MNVKPLPMYVAVKALIFEGEKVLLLRKVEHGFWDTPGGRINPGEHIITALKRELAIES
jgi:8-oxo-dGTP pyrophosphatase MutT (NUDIX family)